jgi:hypothetical protein
MFYSGAPDALLYEWVQSAGRPFAISFPCYYMHQTCVELPTTMELLDALEARIAALSGTAPRVLWPVDPSPTRAHPFSRIEDL